jgi:hypothetical protein
MYALASGYEQSSANEIFVVVGAVAVVGLASVVDGGGGGWTSVVDGGRLTLEKTDCTSVNDCVVVVADVLTPDRESVTTVPWPPLLPVIMATVMPVMPAMIATITLG